MRIVTQMQQSILSVEDHKIKFTLSCLTQEVIISSKFFGGIFLTRCMSCMYRSVTAVIKLDTNCGAVLASTFRVLWLAVFR